MTLAAIALDLLIEEAQERDRGRLLELAAITVGSLSRLIRRAAS